MYLNTFNKIVVIKVVSEIFTSCPKLVKKNWSLDVENILFDLNLKLHYCKLSHAITLSVFNADEPIFENPNCISEIASEIEFIKIVKRCENNYENN